MHASFGAVQGRDSQCRSSCRRLLALYVGSQSGRRNIRYYEYSREQISAIMIFATLLSSTTGSSVPAEAHSCELNHQVP